MKGKETTVFILRNLKTNFLLKFGTKCGWCTEQAARKAFAFHMKTYLDPDGLRGDSLYYFQDEFVIQEVK